MKHPSDSELGAASGCRKCIRVDHAGNRGLVIWTGTLSVDDSDGLRLTEELWNQLTWQ